MLESALSDIGVKVSGRMQIGPTIGAHVGPGVYGVIYVKK
jgi:fatty acid-binding protein DegV